MTRLQTTFAVALVCLSALPGCRDQAEAKQQWQIAAENQSVTPCAVSVKLGGENFFAASTDHLEKGKPFILLAAKPKVKVLSVKVVRGKDEQEIEPETDVPVGKRFTILVAADGKVTTSLTDL